MVNQKFLPDSSDESKKHSSSPDGMSPINLKNLSSSEYRKIDGDEVARPILQQSKPKRDSSSPNKKASKFSFFKSNSSMKEIKSPVRKDLNSSYCEPIDRSNAREIDLIDEQ